MGNMEQVKGVFARNKFGVIVMICCASCLHKVICRKITKRRCMLKKKDVGQLDVCKDWEMSNLLKNAGRSKGVVRDKDTNELIID